MENNYMSNCIFRRKGTAKPHMFFTLKSVKGIYGEGCWSSDEQTFSEFIEENFNTYSFPEGMDAENIANMYNMLSMLAGETCDMLDFTRELKEDVQKNGVVTLTIDLSKMEHHNWEHNFTVAVPMPKPKTVMHIIKKLIGVR